MNSYNYSYQDYLYDAIERQKKAKQAEIARQVRKGKDNRR